MNNKRFKQLREGYITLLGTYLVEYIEASYIDNKERRDWCTSQIDRLTKGYTWHLTERTRKNEIGNEEQKD